MTKRIALGKRPARSERARAAAADRWVAEGGGEDGERLAGPARMKRLSLDLPEDLHTELMLYCVARKTKAAALLRAMIRDMVRGG